MNELKQRYNEVLLRIKNADKWFETASREEQETQAGRYRELIIEIEAAEKAIRLAGVEISREELLEGFKL